MLKNRFKVFWYSRKKLSKPQKTKSCRIAKVFGCSMWNEIWIKASKKAEISFSESYSKLSRCLFMENAANRYKYHNGGETKAQKSPEICLRIYLCMRRGKRGRDKEGEWEKERDREYLVCEWWIIRVTCSSLFSCGNTYREIPTHTHTHIRYILIVYSCYQVKVVAKII